MSSSRLSALRSSQVAVYLALIGVLGIFLALTLRLSLTASLMEGSDQVAHYLLSRFVSQHHRLPITDEERFEAGYKSDWPPLFHIIVGTVGSGIDTDVPPFIKLTSDNPRLQMVFGTEDTMTMRVLTTADPYQSEVLLWYLGRWITIFFSLVALGATFWLLRLFFPAYPWLAVSLTALLAFTPIYVITSGIISYESLLGALLTVYFLVLFYTLKYPQQNWFYLILGLLMGCAALTKYTAFPAVPFLFFFVIWLGHREKWGWRATLWRLTLVGLGLALTLGSWLLYTVIYFNRVAEMGWVAGVVWAFLGDSGDETTVRIVSGLSGVDVDREFQHRDNIFEWFWNFVTGIWRATWLMILFVGLWAIALVGLVRQWRCSSQKRLWITLLGIHIALLMVAPIARYALTGFAKTAEGHHIFFPMAAALLLLLAWGITAWFSPARSTWIFAAAAGLCLVQGVIMVNQVYRVRWPIETVSTVAREPVMATFAGMSLMGYGYTADDQLLQTTLHWRADDLLNDDYQFELTLLDEQDQPRARWLGQPLNGMYPTRAWDIDDRVHDTVSIPVAGLLPGDYQVQLRVIGTDGALDPAVNGQASLLVADDGLILDEVELLPSPVEASDTVILNGQEIEYTFWPQTQLSVEDAVGYGERTTVVISTREMLGDDIHLALVGPDEQPREPVVQVGTVYNFIVEPYYAGGEYRLRFEQGEERVETPAFLNIHTQDRHFDIGPISHPLAANFADQLLLLGYDLPQRKVEAGGTLPVALYWQALRTMGADFIVFSHLVNENQEQWGGNDRLPQEIYSTLFWTPDEIVTDPYNIQIDGNAPDGIYNLLVGVYLPVDQEAVSLPLVQEGQMTEITSVNLGLIKVGQTPPDFTLEQADPEILLNQPFGLAPNLTLLGYDLTDDAGQPIMAGQDTQIKLPQTVVAQIPNLNLTLYWRSEESLSTDYTTFVHLRNAAGEIVAQKDQPPLQGNYPTGLWSSGEIIADEFALPMPADLSPGVYQLVIGMYDFNSGQRLDVPGNLNNELMLFTLEIEN